jgi:hypothetical protein
LASLEASQGLSPFVSDGQHMNLRTLGAFGLSFALFSSPAHAQDDAEEEAEKKPAAAPAEGAEPEAEAKPAATAEVKADANLNVATDASVEKPAAAQAPPGGRPPVYGSRSDWHIDPYGYARFDGIVDSTQSFDDGIQPNLIQRVGTYRGDHRRAIFTARDSRFGIAIGAPEYQGIKTHGVLELDFYGLQVSDAKKHDQVVMGPLRLRHAYVKIETFVDVIAGQYYDVFGWGSHFYPATVGYLGVPGQLYHRNPQLRLEKTLEAGGLELTVAAAAARPGQRDAAGIPDPQGGLKIGYRGWSGVATPGFGRPSLAPISVGVSGMYRHFEVPVFKVEPGSEEETTKGYGFAAQMLLPVIPASSIDDKGNALTLTGEFSLGTGIADMYTGMDGGSRFPLLPNPIMLMPEVAYPQNIDPGLVTIDRTFHVQSINWKALVVGGQYYLPIGDGRVMISGIYSRIWSDNIKTLTPAASWGGIFTKMEYIDANLSIDITPAVAVGFSFQTVKQTFGDVSAPTPVFGQLPMPGVIGSQTVPGSGGVPATARNNRAQMSVAMFF